MPVIVGMWTSAIKQDVLQRRGDARKASADENASTSNPSDFMRLVIASRKGSSSSTIEIRCCDTTGLRVQLLEVRLTPCGPVDALHVGGRQDGGKRWSGYTFVYIMPASPVSLYGTPGS
jgi:hypothetical protein